MRKILPIAIVAGSALAVYGQGTVILENSLGTGYVTLDTANGPKAQAATYQIALLWNNGTSFVQEGAVYQTSSANQDGPGYFNGETVTIPTYSATGTFIIEGWEGNYANYNAAAFGNNGGNYIGQTASFVNQEGEPSQNITPKPISGGTPVGGWNGDLILINPGPEPSTVALGGVGAVLFWLSRRWKTLRGNQSQ